MRKNGNTTVYRESLGTKILEMAMPLFKERGIKAVKMDDIAREMGISKRTLYEIYGNKEELLYECIRLHSDNMMERINEYAGHEGNELRVMTYALKLKLEDLLTTDARYISDLEKYPKIMALRLERREELAKESRVFVKSCVEHGYFRGDINYDIVDRLGDAVMEYVMREKIYNDYSWGEIFHTFIGIHIMGCCTEKGRRFLSEMISEFQE